MESGKRCFDTKALKAYFVEIKEGSTVKDVVNTCALLCLFIFYSLTFFVPRFYGLTEKYVGLFVFLVLSVIFAVNVNPFTRLKNKDADLIAVIILSITAVVNIILVDSGFGCFFVVADFALVWYLSGVIPFKKWQVYLFGILYTLMLIYWFFGVYTWMFADYTSFAMNTNTAATFTIFSMLCVFPFYDALYEKHPAFGLLITIALVKCFQISLYHRSRGAFIMLTVFFVLRFILPKRIWDNRKFYNFMCIFSTIGSLFFVAFYVVLGFTGINFTMPFFYKNIFSGREAIWAEFFMLFKDKPLTGIGTNVTISSFFEFNVHNAMYNILVIHGLIVFALVLFIMYRSWKRVRDGLGSKRVRRCAVAAIFAVCIESFFDVDLIWANYSLNVFILLLIMNSGMDTVE
ncbi:MAG: hypothetical protein K6E49_10510 [Lachnospiraceae bacterium]|nr:hypothetical protein [Lachnospiraceae bacterium]